MNLPLDRPVLSVDPRIHAGPRDLPARFLSLVSMAVFTDCQAAAESLGIAVDSLVEERVATQVIYLPFARAV